MTWFGVRREPPVARPACGVEESEDEAGDTSDDAGGPARFAHNSPPAHGSDTSDVDASSVDDAAE